MHLVKSQMNNSVYFLFIHVKITQLILGTWNSPTPTIIADRSEWTSYVSVKDSWQSVGLQLQAGDQTKCEKETSVYSGVLCPHLHFSVLLGADMIVLQLL